ncbi:ead/Ea22-like family protein [Salmonella enterica subsp. salamae serovar 13,22:z:-]|uniref:ead/Ea22-like family protein n=1 Tax=Salmonella enterica TaxID=28901 RepID=UPI0010343C53|nr:ead/Ea22-like family protein [Salmonella enterica]TBN93366.1 ead/Ea22-like family protein [Salmonella enterica subsp. salamae serovar 13,22:z:-]
MIDKQALRERYSPQPVPKCHICGAEMTIQRMSASRIVYGCTGAAYDDKGCHYTEGRSIADDHYEQSRITIADVSDPEVLMLLDELEAKDKRIAELAAENAAMKLFIRDCCYVFDGEQDEISDAYICATDGGMPQTPATDAFLAEVRAQGIKIAINELVALAPRLDKRAVEILSMAVEKLRKGAAL